ncbi:DUF2177 family protein [Pseudahrensia aquimaris]|uniref:DUF2177 family protein n=1 Tax=Pseudahrensia aquimaris TaxID=744461 RepID=A0ABW3FCB6_9HYPH
MQYLIAYIATLIVFFIIDFIWLGTVAQSFYQKQIGPLLLDEFRIGVAAAFYSVYIIGIVYFAIRPALEANNLGLALLNGALFGFFCYATYDFTNLATLKGYTTTVALVDITWGTFLTASSAFLGAWITRAISG